MEATRFVYRVSDNLTTKRVSPLVRLAELRALSCFDKISYPNPIMGPKFSEYSNAVYEPHGIPIEVLGAPVSDPYAGERNHVVFFGAAAIDFEFLRVAARLRPELMFEIIGPFDQKAVAPNIRYHGELPFEKALPYVRFACLGLNTVGESGFSGSNKEMIYTYYKLNIISSSRPPFEGGNVVFINSNTEEHILDVFDRAMKHHKEFTPSFVLNSWGELAKSLVGD
jgi:hypothetical protein